MVEDRTAFLPVPIAGAFALSGSRLCAIGADPLRRWRIRCRSQAVADVWRLLSSVLAHFRRLHDRIEFRAVPWRIEVRPHGLAVRPRKRARHPFMDRLDETERMRFRLCLSNLLRPHFEPIQPVTQAACQKRLPCDAASSSSSARASISSMKESGGMVAVG